MVREHLERIPQQRRHPMMLAFTKSLLQLPGVPSIILEDFILDHGISPGSKDLPPISSEIIEVHPVQLPGLKAGACPRLALSLGSCPRLERRGVSSANGSKGKTKNGTSTEASSSRLNDSQRRRNPSPNKFRFSVKIFTKIQALESFKRAGPTISTSPRS